MTKTPGSVETDQPGDRFPSLRPSLQFAALGLAAVYALGFVAANAHFAGLGLPRTGLLQSRYLAAGVATTVLLSVPFVMGGLLSHTYTTARRPWTNRRIRLLILVTGVTFGLGWLAWWGCLPLITVPDRVVGAGDWFQFYFMLWSAAVGFTPIVGRWLRSPLDAEVMIIPILTIGLFVAAAIFGAAIYGSVMPAWGGGAGWEGVIRVTTPDGPSQEPAIIVERSEQFVTILRCADGDPPVVSVEVPLARIVDIELHRMVDARRFKAHGGEDCPVD